jgi:hypothetical protein
MGTGNGTGVRVGSRSRGPDAARVVRAATIEVESGGVWVGWWSDRRGTVGQIGHRPRMLARASLIVMTQVSPHRGVPRLGTLLGGSVFGGLLMTAGLGMAYLTLATPLTSVLSANQTSGIGRASIGLVIWSISLVAGGALLLAGTNRLVTTVARLRAGRQRPGPATRALASMAEEVVVVMKALPYEGRAIPELAIGAFGAAVIHALPSSRQIRQAGAYWEAHMRDGWLRTENPIEVAMRDAERVRHWISMADLDFVVRVYAALVVTDLSVPRSASCAVLTADQLPAWIASLPRQRSLSPTRRLRLLGLAAPLSTPG